MNIDQDIKKFFKPTKVLKNQSQDKTPVNTSNLHRNNVDIKGHDYSLHNHIMKYIDKPRQQTTFKVNIIVEKKIYANHYKGAYSLYLKKKGSCFFLIEPLIDRQTINIHTNFTRTQNHSTTFSSDKRSPSLKYIINQCWQIIYNIQDRIPARIKNKYWKRITTLLKNQHTAINDRLNNNHNSKKSKQTRTFFKFTYAQNIFYFGWWHSCNTCNRNVAFVEKNNIKFCPYHTKKTHLAIDTSFNSQNQLSIRDSKQEKKLQTFHYLHNVTYKKEIFSKRLNARYVKFYKWIDKKNWGFADMDLSDSTDTNVINYIPQECHLIYQPTLSFTNSFSEANYSKEVSNTKTGLVIVTEQMDTISKRNAKQQKRWNRFFKQYSNDTHITNKIQYGTYNTKKIGTRNNLKKFFVKNQNDGIWKSKMHFKLSPHVSSEWNQIDNNTSFHPTNDLYMKDGIISIKSDDFFEFRLLSIEEAKAKHLTNKAEEEHKALIEIENKKKSRMTELEKEKKLEEIKIKNILIEEERLKQSFTMRQRSIALQQKLDQEIEDRNLRLQLGTASDSDIKTDILDFLDDAPCIKIDINDNHYKRSKLKYIHNCMLQELEQEQLIINHSLVEECEKHNIDVHLVKLIPITQHAEYSESMIYDKTQNFSVFPESFVKKHKRWLENKTKKLNRLHSSFISKLGAIQATDDEYKDIEEKILAPARIKLANAKTITDISARNKYIEKLTFLIELHENSINSWNNEFRKDRVTDLNQLRKEYILASLEAFEIPTRFLPQN